MDQSEFVMTEGISDLVEAAQENRSLQVLWQVDFLSPTTFSSDDLPEILEDIAKINFHDQYGDISRLLSSKRSEIKFVCFNPYRIVSD